MEGWMDGWMDGRKDGKAGLRIAYSNQKDNLCDRQAGRGSKKLKIFVMSLMDDP